MATLNKFKILLKNILPTYLYRFWNLRTKKSFVSENTLFDGNDEIFKGCVSNCRIYAEYGCGASTIWVAANTNCQIYSTDSSEVWIKWVGEACKRRENIHLHYSDLGPVGDWGIPLSYDKSSNFSDYANYIWTLGVMPDVVLIDGRFRVFCFLTSLINASKGTAIIFDDYADRKCYHFVERFLRPVKIRGRQALFITPGSAELDIAEIKNAIIKFEYVFD